MVPRPPPADRFVDLCRTLAGDDAPAVLCVSGAGELRRALAAAALTGAPTRIVAAVRPGEVPSWPGLWRRADAVLVEPSARETALRAGIEPARLREADPGTGAVPDAGTDAEAALRDVRASHRRRVAYRRRLERRNRVRRAIPWRARR